ncbi:MAG: hypothetical protein AAFV62_11505 [Pseudomonadota bacterium]
MPDDMRAAPIAALSPFLLARALAPGARHPARYALGLGKIDTPDGPAHVHDVDTLPFPFCTLTRHSTAIAARGRPLLLVSPISGHYPLLMRDLAAQFLPDRPVYIPHWINARDVPLSAGGFSIDDQISYLAAMIEHLGADTDVVALCQAGVPTLVASALVAEQDPGAAPRSLTLMASPIDPLANPTSVVTALRAKSLNWYRHSVLKRVGRNEPGEGRLVYPATTQLSGILTYLSRHIRTGGELFYKTMADDGLDPVRYPFVALLTSLMDLPGEVFLSNIETVFHQRRICDAAPRFLNRDIDLASLARTKLLTIEGERDDIAAPGQTSAAHDLCPGIEGQARGALILRNSGHFSLFYGALARDTVAPQILAFAES